MLFNIINISWVPDYLGNSTRPFPRCKATVATYASTHTLWLSWVQQQVWADNSSPADSFWSLFSSWVSSAKGLSLTSKELALIHSVTTRSVGSHLPEAPFTQGEAEMRRSMSQPPIHRTHNWRAPEGLSPPAYSSNQPVTMPFTNFLSFLSHTLISSLVFFRFIFELSYLHENIWSPVLRRREGER